MNWDKNNKRLLTMLRCIYKEMNILLNKMILLKLQDFFQKMFSYMNVIDVAYKYGYDSSTSFTKTFQIFHGMTPKQVKNQNVQ